MKRRFPEVAVMLVGFALWGTTLHGNNDDSNEVQKTAPSPFVVSIVPAWSWSSGRGISMATNTLDTFYVLLTNVSTQAQAVFGTSNSWGYYAVSFELRTGDGRIGGNHQEASGVHDEHPKYIRDSTRRTNGLSRQARQRMGSGFSSSRSGRETD
jgi:hypothetical protein